MLVQTQRLCRLLFRSANVCVLKIQSSSSRRHIFQILDKVNNIIQVHCPAGGGWGREGGGVFLGIRSRGVQRGSLNPDPISDQKCHFSHPFSDLSPRKCMSSLILRLEQQQKIHIHIYKIFLFLSYSFGIETNNAFIHSSSSLESHSRFQTKMGKVYTSFKTGTVQNHPL